MSRFFLEVSYLGYAYSGSQIQINGITVQELLENVLTTFLKEKILLFGASRTDSGVHAYQNFFHFDTKKIITQKQLYNLNALLPFDIAINNIHPVKDTAHCRFDAIKRSYKYFIHQYKNPFLQERSYYYPYKISYNLLQQTSEFILQQHFFQSFSKKHTQVKTFDCQIYKSTWCFDNLQKTLIYEVTANRFLRGMVKALVSTQLKVARNLRSFNEFENLFQNPISPQADFYAPSHGLFLLNTKYPKEIFL
ncbi:MAG: tRNA pseudouridine(38-40) synthase TruA [Chitinophagaceae bacterium]